MVIGCGLLVISYRFSVISCRFWVMGYYRLGACWHTAVRDIGLYFVTTNQKFGQDLRIKDVFDLNH